MSTTLSMSTKSSFVQRGVLVAAEDRRSKEAVELCLEVSDETSKPLDFVGLQGFRPLNDRP